MVYAPFRSLSMLLFFGSDQFLIDWNWWLHLMINISYKTRQTTDQKMLRPIRNSHVIKIMKILFILLSMIVAFPFFLRLMFDWLQKSQLVMFLSHRVEIVWSGKENTKCGIGKILRQNANAWLRLVSCASYQFILRLVCCEQDSIEY